MAIKVIQSSEAWKDY